MEEDELSVTIIRDALEEGIEIDEDIKRLAAKFEADKKKTFKYKLKKALTEFLDGKVIPAILALLTAALGYVVALVVKYTTNV